MIPIKILITIGMLVLYFAAVTPGAVKEVVRAMPFSPPPICLHLVIQGGAPTGARLQASVPPLDRQ